MSKYQDIYTEKKCTPQEIASRFEDGWSCVSDIAACMPPAILDALGERSKRGEINGIKLHALLDIFPVEAFSQAAAKGITPITWFSGKQLAKSVNEGRGDLMPCYYRDMPAVFDEYIDIDAMVAAVSPMDQHGYFSVGAAGSIAEVFIKKAKHIFLEVNKEVPRTLSAPMIHISQVEAFCENDRALPAFPPAQIDEISEKIGSYIVEEITDGATIQLGIGAVPDAVGLALREKKDLGIHTELMTDSLVELIECGAVTNAKKPIHRGKTVAVLAFGSKRLYDYMDDNPSFLMLPVGQVNSPAIISQIPNFVSVNAALEVDFYGQVCAEGIGTSHISGTGGQADYVRGAVMSKGGKSFIAFPSTAKNGEISRIKPTLTEGALVTTSKNDVDYIVTEYGLAKLRGKTLSERVKALIGIAHPKFRDELTYAAKKQNILI